MRKIIAALMCAAMCQWASAQMDESLIRAYNEAAPTNDPAKIVPAALALGENAMANPDDPNATVTAFEAAQQICMRGNCEQTQALAAFLSTRDATALPESGVQILGALSEWRAKPDDRTAATLVSTLDDAKNSTPSMLSLFAVQAALQDAVISGDSKRTLHMASLTKAHVAPVREVVPKIYSDAAIIHAATKFNTERSTEVLNDLADLKIFLHGLKRADKLPETMDKDRYLVDAWSMAISAFAISEAQNARLSPAIRAGHERNDKEARQKLDAYFEALPPKTNGALPACKGKPLRPPKPKYPRAASRRGYVGAVLAGFKVEDGKVKDTRILASVPDAMFEEAVLEAMEDMGWKWEDNPDLTTCSTSSSVDVVMPFKFALR